MSVAATKDESFNRHFKEFIIGSMMETDECVLNDPAYKAAQDEQLKHEDEIRRLLGAENQDLFLDYDNMVGRRMAIAERYVYKRGMADGIKLCVALGIVTR
jgi:hypothetical protein